MPSSPPNILLLFPDQWRWDWLGHHDGSASPFGDIPVHTPHIDALAKRGVRFTQCRTNSPICSPARACLATGRRYEHCGVHGNEHVTASDPPTVFKLLRDAGYHTATCGKSDLFKPDHTNNPTGYLPIMQRLGFSDGIDHRGKGDAINIARQGGVEPYTQMLKERGLLQAHLDDHPQPYSRRPTGPTPLPNDAYTDDFAGHNALLLLDRAPADRPWMLWVNFPGPHPPFDPPADALKRYEGVNIPPPVAPHDNPAPHQNAEINRRHYAAECSNLDDWVGRIVSHLESTDQLNNTLIVFASDHGDMLGDHGLWGKVVPHEGSTHVPLIVAGPGISAGQTRDDLAELIDISATLLHTANLPTPKHWDARPLFGADASPREAQVSALGEWRMICNTQHKLIMYDDGRRELYDLAADAGELNNLAGTLPDTVDALARQYESETANSSAS